MTRKHWSGRHDERWAEVCKRWGKGAFMLSVFSCCGQEHTGSVCQVPTVLFFFLPLLLSFTSLHDPTPFSARVRGGKPQSLTKLKGFSANSWIHKNFSSLPTWRQRRPPAAVSVVGRSDSRVAKRCVWHNFIYESQQNYCFRHSGARGACFRSLSRFRIWNTRWNISKLLWVCPPHLSGEEPVGSILERGGEAVQTLEAQCWRKGARLAAC